MMKKSVWLHPSAVVEREKKLFEKTHPVDLVMGHCVNLWLNGLAII